MSSRRKILHVAADVMVEMLHGHKMCEVVTDMPSDAVIVGCGWDESRNTVRLAVESETFDEVEDGYFAPDFDLHLTWRRSELEAAIHLLTPESEDAS